MKKYGTAAGLPAEKQQFHALKHSIGTHILDAGEYRQAIEGYDEALRLKPQ